MEAVWPTQSMVADTLALIFSFQTPQENKWIIPEN